MVLMMHIKLSSDEKKCQVDEISDFLGEGDGQGFVIVWKNFSLNFGILTCKMSLTRCPLALQSKTFVSYSSELVQYSRYLIVETVWQVWSILALSRIALKDDVWFI